MDGFWVNNKKQSKAIWEGFDVKIEDLPLLFHFES